MELVLKAAFERDVDLVLVRAFYEGNSVAQHFLNDGDRILEVHHSAMELHGESDLQVIVERKGKRHAILIEDKIDAPAQPNQYKRYCERGDRGKVEGRWTEYTVYIVAPEKYLNSDHEAIEYPNKVSYEEIREELMHGNDPVSLATIETALKRSEGALPSVVDEAVTAFWESYYDYHEQHAPHLMLHVNRCKKGPNAIWPDFKTVLKGTKILHKSAQGCVDLEFRGFAEQLNRLKDTLRLYLSSDMKIERTGGSAVVRIPVPVIDFSKPFVTYEEEIGVVFSAVERLNQLATIICENKLLEKFKKESVFCYDPRLI